MKYFIISFLLCLPALVSAQASQKDKNFINEVITQKERTKEQSLNEYLGIDKASPPALPRLKHLYEDSVGRSAINNLNTAMKTYNRNVFYSIRNDSVTYIDSLGKRMIIAKSATYRLNTLNKWRLEGIVSDSIVITDQERVYINSEIDKMQPGHLWGKGFLGDAERVSDPAIKKITSNTKGDPWHELRGKGFDKSYYFSVPIYLRNDTYCLFYYGYSCGWRCGYGEVAIYKQVNGKWTHWSKLTSWQS